MKMDQEIIDGLVLRAQKGDADSFSRIYDELLTPVFRFCFFRVPSQEIAEDITSEVFLTVWKSLDKYTKNEKVQFSSWVFRIAQNKIIDYFRSKKDTLELKEELETPSSPHNEGQKKIDNDILRKELNTALTKIPETQAQSIILKHFSELSNTEIAQIMNKSETAIRILQSRGLKAIRKHIDI